MIVVRLDVITDVVRGEKDSADVCNPIARITVCDESPVDLKLVSVDGIEVSQQIKQDENLRLIPVIIWTSSSDKRDIEISFSQGTNSSRAPVNGEITKIKTVNTRKIK